MASVEQFAGRAWRVVRHPYWSYVKFTTGGMLRATAYRRLHDLARALPDLPFVEVGSARGAGTVALARGVRAAGGQARIVAVEKGNLTPLRHTLARFGVSRSVAIYGERFADEALAAFVHKVGGGGRIAGFLSDADARLDRDVAILWPMVVPDGPIVIDDYGTLDMHALVNDPHENGRKLLMTRRGVDFMVSKGLLALDEQHGRTLFGRKPKSAPALSDDTMEGLREVILDARRVMRRKGC